MAEFEEFTSEQQLKKQKQKNGWTLFGNIIFYVVLFLLIFFFSWFVVFKTTHSCFVVDGTSMMPTYNATGKNTDIVYTSAYKDVTRDDVVVLEAYNSETGKNYNIIKRAIGLGGDWVCLKLDTETNLLHTYRIENATAEEVSEISSTSCVLEETYLQSEIDENYTITITTKTISGSSESVTYNYCDYYANYYEYWTYYSSTPTTERVENNKNTNLVYLDSVYYDKKFYCQFLANYTDSTYANEFLAETQDGVLFYRVPENTIFYLGDNRAVSKDSRSVGCTSTENLIGVVDIELFNSSQNERFWGVVKYYFKSIFG